MCLEIETVFNLVKNSSPVLRRDWYIILHPRDLAHVCQMKIAEQHIYQPSVTADGFSTILGFRFGLCAATPVGEPKLLRYDMRCCGKHKNVRDILRRN